MGFFMFVHHLNKCVRAPHPLIIQGKTCGNPAREGVEMINDSSTRLVEIISRFFTNACNHWHSLVYWFGKSILSQLGQQTSTARVGLRAHMFPAGHNSHYTAAVRFACVTRTVVSFLCMDLFTFLGVIQIIKKISSTLLLCSYSIT